MQTKLKLYRLNVIHSSGLRLEQYFLAAPTISELMLSIDEFTGEEENLTLLRRAQEMKQQVKEGLYKVKELEVIDNRVS
jgi:hypothetical protein